MLDPVKGNMKIPFGYCDFRVESVNNKVIENLIQMGYSWIAVNTTLDCSLLDLGSSNRKKRKYSEMSGKNEEDFVPPPKLIKIDNSKFTVLNRLTIKITKAGELQRILKSQNSRLYNIIAVEPMADRIFQDILNSPSIDIVVCNTKTTIYPKDYSAAVDKNIYFEISYGPMLINSTARQETFTIAHSLHIKGKSKNVIVSSGAANSLDVRSPHDVMNLGFLLGLSKKQSKESITQACHSIILKSYGRKFGKTAVTLIPVKNQVQNGS